MIVVADVADPDEFIYDFPTLFVAHAWAEQHCVVPDGFDAGAPWQFVGWQTWCLLNFYRLKPQARYGQKSGAFFWRTSQIVLPQKAGKAPYSAAHICIEAVGPALFAGWAQGGEVWDCEEHGCGCGWVYAYEPGEAMGMQWPTPLIQITATSGDQTDNIYGALKPMIDEGPLSLIMRTGEEFIRLPGDGRIDTVTSSATSRLGQRVTYVPHDEPGIYLKANGMIEVADTQARGVAAMGGRTEQTTNAWDPTQQSYAQRTAREAKLGNVFRYHPQAPRHLSYRNKAERAKIHDHVYGGSPWVDRDGIEDLAAALIVEDAAQAERFFGNRLVAGGGPAFEIARWDKLRKQRKVPQNAVIVIGVDGARHEDALAIIACEVKTGHTWPLAIIERPDDADEFYEHDQNRADGAVREAFEKYVVWRLYADPHHIEYLIEGWQNDYGEKRVIPWYTNRQQNIAWAVRNFTVDAIANGELSHPGDEQLDEHIFNARKQPVKVVDDKERPMHSLGKDSWRSPRKIDAAMAAVIAWQARSDAIKKRAVHVGPQRAQPEPEPERPRSWRPGTAPRLKDLTTSQDDGAPMGDIS